MGRIVHDAIVVTTTDYRPGGLPDIDAFRATLPDDFRPLVIGPIPAPLNDYVSYAFLPDGSKEGWGTSDEGDTYRAQFAALFNHSFDDTVAIRYGEDHREKQTEPEARYTR